MAQKVLNELELFFKENKIMYSICEMEKEYLVCFECSIPFYADEETVVNDAQFELVIDKGRLPLRSKIYMVGKHLPFHPHFYIYNVLDTAIDIVRNISNRNLISLKKAEWIDYKNYQKDECIVCLLKRVILSLQFHSEYVYPPNCKVINKNAGNWYLDKIRNNPNAFQPTFLFDKKFEVKVSDRQFKKFDIKDEDNHDSKKFEILNEGIEKKKKFHITEKKTGYSPIEKNFIFPKDEISLSIQASSNKENDKINIFITKKAAGQIFNHILWGEITKKNVYEQGGILVGNVFMDKELGVQYAIVEQAIAGINAKGSPAYLEISPEVWKDMIDEVDLYLDKNPNKNIQIIGWYHTHPNNLSVFMSSTDKNTQRLYFNQNWQYAIVLNPQKRIWKAFYGKHADECSGYIMHDNGDSTIKIHKEKIKNEDNDEQNEHSKQDDKSQQNDECPKQDNKSNVKLKSIIYILSACIFFLIVALIISINPFKKDKKISNTTTITSSIDHDYNETVVDNSQEATILIKEGDKLTLPIGIEIYDTEDLSNKISFVNNHLEITALSIESSSIAFEQELFVGIYHLILPKEDYVQLKNNALLKNKKTQRNQEKEAESVFITVLSDSRKFEVIERDNQGWFKIRYNGFVNKEIIKSSECNHNR